ncbi:MAG: UDP-N-acetylmuramoyl-L-alanine--D-glutamate ligase, partial [Candidatus Nanopelagicales bacterium]
MTAAVDRLERGSDWSAQHVTVAGIGIAGYAAADVFMWLGAQVTIVDASDGERQRERAGVLEALGARVRLGHDGPLPIGTDLVVVSPGLRPSDGLVVDASRSGIPVWGELELAWRLRGADEPAAWLCVTGTNNKT